jgi:hypothetical protein
MRPGLSLPKPDEKIGPALAAQAAPRRLVSAMLFWAVVSDSTDEAVELFTTREEAEAIVQAWDRDEPYKRGRCGSRGSSSSSPN